MRGMQPCALARVALVLSLSGLLLACPRSSAEGPAEGPNEDPAPARPVEVEVEAPEPPPEVIAPESEAERPEAKSAEVRSEARVAITEAEAKTIYEQIVARVQAIPEGDRKELSAATKTFTFYEGADDSYYISGFHLRQSDDDGLVLGRRGKMHQAGFVTYQMQVERSGKTWKVGPIETTFVHRRR